MRVLEILQESSDNDKINEAPVGVFKQGLRKLGSAAAGAVGAKGLSANLSGKVAAGDKANQLFVAYNRYVGQQNKSFNDADAGDLKDFLASKNISDKYVTANDTDVLSKDEINDVFVKAATDTYKKNRPAAATPAPVQEPSGNRSTVGNILNTMQNLSDEEQQQLFNQLAKLVKGQPQADQRKEPTIRPSNVVNLPSKDTNVSI